MCLISLCPKNVVLSFDPSLAVNTVCGWRYQTYLLDPRDCRDATHKSTILTLATGTRSGSNTGGLRLTREHRLQSCLQVPQSECRLARSARTACARNRAWKCGCRFSSITLSRFECWKHGKENHALSEEHFAQPLFLCFFFLLSRSLLCKCDFGGVHRHVLLEHNFLCVH